MAINQTNSDAILIQRYAQGEEYALKCLIEKHQAKVYNFIYSKIGDRDVSDDIFQDTFIKVVDKIKTNTYNEEGKFLPWVMRIAHNLTIDYFRNQKKVTFQRGNDEFDAFAFIKDNALNIESKLIENQVFSDLYKLISFLPDDQKEIINLRFFEDLSFKEISELKNISINTALGRMRYAVINLRKLIEKNNIILTN